MKKPKSNLDIDIGKFNEKLSKETGEVPVLDLTNQVTSGFLDNLKQCIQSGIKMRQGDFYIVVIRKHEPIVNGRVLRNLFLHRHTCPTPNYDQIVYKYTLKNNQLDQIWVIPSRNDCYLLKDNALEAFYGGEADLLQYVLDFEDGTLAKLASKLNGEKEFSLELTEEKLKQIRK